MSPSTVSQDDGPRIHEDSSGGRQNIDHASIPDQTPSPNSTGTERRSVYNWKFSCSHDVVTDLALFTEENIHEMQLW